MASFSHHIEGIETIGLLSISFVDNLSSVSVENSPLAVGFSEAFEEPLSDTIDVISINFCSDLKIMITEHDVLIIGREKDSSVLFSNYPEVEGLICVFESDGRG
jgi:hypothetical protein